MAYEFKFTVVDPNLSDGYKNVELDIVDKKTGESKGRTSALLMTSREISAFRKAIEDGGKDIYWDKISL